MIVNKPGLWHKLCVKGQLKAIHKLVLDSDLSCKRIVCVPLLIESYSYNQIFSKSFINADNESEVSRNKKNQI